MNKATSVHHMLHDTKPNRKKYPLLIDSVFNGIPLCQQCHQDKPHLFNIPYSLAEVFENELKRNEINLDT
jgi:hypothetical protein